MAYEWEAMFETEEKLTYGQTLKPAMIMTDPEEAKAYKAALIQYGMDKHGQSKEEALDIANQNLGYFAGYYDHETRLRVEELFECRHPVFGEAKKGSPDPIAAFAAGKLLGAEEEE